MNSDKYLPSLTPLRGIAALLVLLHHLTTHYLPTIGNSVAVYSSLLRNSFLLVDFFFILSGFILAHLYFDRLHGDQIKPQYREFLVARLARIYPVHLATLLAMFVLAIAQRVAQIHNQGLHAYLQTGWLNMGLMDIGGLVLNFSLLQALPPNATMNQPAWSIGAEWFAYLAFPMLLLPIRLIPTFNKYLCIPIVLIGLGWIEWQYGTLDLSGLPGVLRCLLECWLGVTIYGYFKDNQVEQGQRPNLILILALLASAMVMHFNWYQTLAIMPLAIVIYSAVKNTGWPSDILNSRPLKLLGDISFSVYMTHWVVMSWILWLWKGVAGKGIQDSFNLNVSILVLIGTTTLILLISYASYRRIEVPFRGILRAKLASSNQYH